MIEYYLGIDSDYILLGLAGFVVILLIILLVNAVQIHKLKKKYKMFMDGKNAKTLEESIMSRMDQMDYLISSNKKNENDIQTTLIENISRKGKELDVDADPTGSHRT